LDHCYTRTPPLSALGAQLAEKVKSWHWIEYCPACEAKTIARFATVRQFSHSRCTSCGFTFVNPIPDEQALHDFYNSEFYANYRRLEERRIARGEYFSASMYTDMRRLADWIITDGSISILDYGCGPGAFLAFLRDKCGMQNVEGIEINRDSIQIGKQYFNLNIVTRRDELKQTAYDCVLLLEVIEHVPLPDRFFREVAGLVKPGGKILITTPAVDNLLGMFLPRQCQHYTAPSHVSLFTKKAVERLMSRFGFAVERIELDDSVEIIEKAVLSLFYRLDFASPMGDSDRSDSMYVPTALGQLVGRKSRRQIPRCRLPFGMMDGVLRRAVKRSKSVPRNNHLYVIGKKCLKPTTSDDRLSIL